MGVLLNLMILILFMIASSIVKASGLSVQPLFLEFTKGKKTRSEPFEFTVQSEKNMKVKIDLYKAFQEKSGKLNFVQDTNESKDVIVLKKNKFETKSNIPLKIEGKINYPKNADKTFLYALMVEEDKSSVGSGVSINIRYAIILKINSNIKKSQTLSKIHALSMEKRGDKVIVFANVQNTGKNDFYVEMVIRRPS